ncbi:hypothetical protein GEV33_010848 [Tenebrio molitor]|uniref:RNA-directed DNA polymerase n=1 Tax=Tenebrio molitor TaxID=7067 RepID=A0A8J6LA76_TENMO|nr:hypothetical protein GEV33_010848 [Tenebrio molitor]
MPKNKRHRKQSPSSSSSSSSVSSDSTDSTSTSDSSSSDSSQEKRHLKRKVRKLKRKLSTKSNRYEGKIDSVPMFGGGFEEMNVQQWIHTINATGDVFGWDDKARIFCMTNKLRGNAKSWYNNQDKLDLSWKQWKKNLIEAFPPQQGVFDKLKELVNVQREKHQSLVDFYYRKLGLGHACKLDDHVTVDIIINTINDPFLKSGARAAGCVKQREPIRASGSGFVKNRLGKRSPIPVVNDSKVVKCYLCGREGHKKVDCFKYKSDKTCNHCKIKGHVEDECFKKKREIKPDETNVVIEGYGGAMINPIGIVKTEVEIDEIKTVTNFYVVPDTLQTVDILVDLKAGYHQIPMAEDSKKFTAFITPDGHYQYTRMPFGLTNAPAVFQRAINMALGLLRHEYALVYLDDILVISKTVEEGLERLDNVLNALNKAGLTLNLEKCEFLKNSIEYLGTEISEGVLKPAPKKLEAVNSFPVPTNVHQLRQFIGLASYFRKFIPNFALVARPLTSLLKKAAEWNWQEQQQEAFDKLKAILTATPTLGIFNVNSETQVHTDASKVGLGAALLQKQANGNWKPIAYMSRQTTDPETRYHSYELETLAVYEAVKRFRNFLFGRHFVIVTDCNAMRLTWQKRDLTPRVGRWWLAMQDFDFEVEHRPGCQMVHVDSLSRNPVPVGSVNTNDWVCGVQYHDEDLQLIKSQVLNNEAEKCYTIKEDKVCRIVDGEPKIIIPRDVRWRVVKMFHDDNGHPGFDRTLDAIRQNYWFSDMRRFVKKFVGHCIACMTAKRPTGKRQAKLHPIEKIAEPFHTLHLDHLGPFCKTSNEPVPNTSSSHACQTLANLIKLVHVPKRVITDRGKAFDCQEFRQFCASQNIVHVKNAIASPRSNGQIERSNRTILEALSASVDGKHDDWDNHVAKIQRGINSTKNATTGIAPSELLYGLRPEVQNEVRLTNTQPKDVQTLREEAKRRCDAIARKMKERYDKNRKEAVRYKEGDIVLVERTLLVKGLSSGKLVPKYIGPVKIIAVLGNDRYRVASFSKDRRRFKGVVASDRLKLFVPQDAEIDLYKKVLERSFSRSSVPKVDRSGQSETQLSTLWGLGRE